MSEALRRLQDMLAGWSEFKAKEVAFLLSGNDLEDPGFVPTEQDKTDANAAIIEEDAISDLYQDAGNITANDPVYDENEPNPERVKAFIIERVIPFIMNGH